MDEKKEVIKARPAIQITGYITLLQKQAWNVMLAHAYDLLPTQETYQIKLDDLAKAVGFDSKNEEYLKESLRALVDCKVEWNLLDDKGRKEWGVSTTLAQARIKEGIVTYAYSPFLRKELYSPEVYTKLSLLMQTQFKSKHALTLYELCVDKKKVGSTGWITLTTFKELMGVQSGSVYHDFRMLNRDVIKPSIKEINKVSDLHVKVSYDRERRKVVALKFTIEKKAKPAKDSTAKEKTRALVEASIEASGVQAVDVEKLKGEKKEAAQQSLFAIIEKVKLSYKKN